MTCVFLCERQGSGEPGGVRGGGATLWATREFHVKWRRWSYIHCSWDTRETLSQLGGYKRVLNYMKRFDAQQARGVPVPLLPPAHAWSWISTAALMLLGATPQLLHWIKQV